MIVDFLVWWRTQLVDLLPAVLRRSGADDARLVLITLLSPLDAMPPVVEVSTPRRGRRPPQRLELAAAGLARLRAVLAPERRERLRLRLPPGPLLERAVVLPLAAERAPEQVLGYELDRLTPFTAAEAFWSCEITRRDRAQGKLHLRLTLAPRAVLAPLLETLRGAGAVPGELEAPGAAPGTWRRIRLQAPQRRQTGARLALGLAAGLAVAAVALPFVRQSLALAKVAADIAVLTPQVGEATALRRQLAVAAQSGDVLAAERMRLGDALRALAVVTEALPDDTWLTDLTLRQRQLTLGGQSATAVRLIARLAADPSIRNPGFTAPVTRSETGRTDLFAIGAELAP